MVGQGSPIKWRLTGDLRVFARRFVPIVRCLALVVAMCGIGGSHSNAESTTVRLRIAWGSGDGAKHRWYGTVSCAGATLADLQPLGVESDASAAIQLVENELRVEPLVKRGFDGCDVTITADLESNLRFNLRTDQSTAPTIVDVPLSKVINGQIKEPIDSLESFILVYRCPGDRLRVASSRENLIFQPGETWPLKLQVDFSQELKQGPVVVEAKLYDDANSQVAWEFQQTVTTETTEQNFIEIDVVCPQAEGAYQLSITARPEENFTTRLVPGQRTKPYVTREIDLVVVDPLAKLPLLTDHWTPILTIDPANPSWWQRLPSWAQVTRLSGKSSGSIGNVRLTVRPDDADGLVELASASPGSDPAWQSFTLPVLEVGVPHLVEITFPENTRQELGISIIEPDAAGRVNSSVLDSGFYVDEILSEKESSLATHRIVFWPRTLSPQLLIVNRHATLPGVFGKIILSRQDEATSSLAIQPERNLATGRLLAAYIGKPKFTQNFGASEKLDSASGMSVQSWSTFLEGTQRMTQYLRLSGFNTVFTTVSADGSALYPSELLKPSPRYDTGQLAASGQDPFRKDVLEMMLRVCDREAIRFIPTLELASPLPRLENLRSANNPLKSGITCIDVQGRELRGAGVQGSTCQFGYNLLNESVQNEILSLVDQLAERACGHTCCVGIGIQLESTGYGMLPGLEWGFDDKTCADFSEATGIELPLQGENRVHERAAILLGPELQTWRSWRSQRLTSFYTKVAERVRSHRVDAQVFLLTEDLFSSPLLKQAIRQNMTNSGKLGQLLAARGISLDQLAAIDGIQIANPMTQISSENLQENAATVGLNELVSKGELLPTEYRTTDQLIYPVSLSHLESFDNLSPYGKQMTHLVSAHQPIAAGVMRDYQLMGVLSHRPFPHLLVGGDYLPMTLDSRRRSLFSTLEQLPEKYTESRTLQKQPILLRLQRTSDATYLVCHNESPWKVQVQVNLGTSKVTDWQLLGTNSLVNEGDQSTSSGILPPGDTLWTFEIEPFALQAWKLDDLKLQIDNLRIMDDGLMKDYLEQKIAAIQDRTGNLNIERNYHQLQNPGFEIKQGTTRIFGWQVRKGPTGIVAVETEKSHSGANVLRLKSEDRMGVAVQSHLFPIPETGQISVGAYLRAGQMDPDSRLIIAVESEDDGRTYRRNKIFTAAEIPTDQWTRCELSLTDLPVGSGDQIRIQFHVVGNTDLLLDDIDLCDLRFDEQRRGELVKRVYAAKTALGDQQVVDCLRLVNEYWSRYLVQYVPPIERDPVVIAKQPPATESNPEENRQKVGGRLRRFVPKIWR